MQFIHNSFSRIAIRALAIAVLAAAPITAYSASTIAGSIYDDQRNPIHSVDVELLNEVYSLLLRVKTDGSGRYEFNNLPDGRYYVRVLPFRFNLRDETREVIVHTVSLLGGGGSGYQIEDFYLKRKEGVGRETTNEVVFVQEIPESAKMLYEDGITAIKNENLSIGIEKLTKAIEEFPEYFDALQRLGTEMMQLKEYLEAAKLFMRAADVNPKSTASLYNLGLSLHSIGKEYNKAALVALKKAGELAPASYQVELQIGKIERQEGNFEEAEKRLLNAKKLADHRVAEIHKELAQLYGNDLKDYGKAADELELYLKASNTKDENTRKQIQRLREKAKSSS